MDISHGGEDKNLILEEIALDSSYEWKSADKFRLPAAEKL
jgi:hypothetical protein